MNELTKGATGNGVEEFRRALKDPRVRAEVSQIGRSHVALELTFWNALVQDSTAMSMLPDLTEMKAITSRIELPGEDTGEGCNNLYIG